MQFSCSRSVEQIHAPPRSQIYARGGHLWWKLRTRCFRFPSYAAQALFTYTSSAYLFVCIKQNDIFLRSCIGSTLSWVIFVCICRGMFHGRRISGRSSLKVSLLIKTCYDGKTQCRPLTTLLIFHRGCRSQVSESVKMQRSTIITILYVLSSLAWVVLLGGEFTRRRLLGSGHACGLRACRAVPSSVCIIVIVWEREGPFLPAQALRTQYPHPMCAGISAWQYNCNKENPDTYRDVCLTAYAQLSW